ncbi:1-deoxy-D-xylulose-5-phosphate synthase [Streptosporangium sp. OZ121]|uniref:1-deoxy-D-xylulose-5-phosphate synthase n=1 Tax=Streptosporangium sp. OZ121 TaxID=3444183 RepID=UPI003F7B2B30
MSADTAATGFHAATVTVPDPPGPPRAGAAPGGTAGGAAAVDGLLERIGDPGDLRRLPSARLPALAGEIRRFLVDKVSATGGHLGSNLGAVELSVALHRVFASPQDAIVFDTGHQAYVHKILTGRRDDFDGLRQPGGLSGYPSRAESVHDVVENSHASTALSYADGLAKAVRLSGRADRHVVAVIGDGALTGGLALEAVNNLGAAPGLPVIVVINDNGRSYARTAGGLAAHLAALRRSRPGLPDPESRGDGEEPRRAPREAGEPGETRETGNTAETRDAGDGRDATRPAGTNVFEALGFSYLGPVDGHDIDALEGALLRARALGRPVVVHAVTVKGKGYGPAEDDEADRMHGIGVLDPATGRPPAATAATPPSWTSVFAKEITAIGAERPAVIAITAAMPGPTGLAAFAARFPDRFVDVGIAEQHAVTCAAGLAMNGMHPVVAMYATFCNRAFDQALMDVALHRLPVTLVLDRAGITGPDGPSHHGMWDLVLLGMIPGLRIAAPRDATRLREALHEAVGFDGGPTAIRYPKASVGPDIVALRRLGGAGGVDVLAENGDRVLLVAVGSLAGPCVAAAAQLRHHGVGATVVDPRWVDPVHPALVELAASHGLVVTVEDGLRTGGVGAAVATACADADLDTPVRALGLPREFIGHGDRAHLLAAAGLDHGSITASVLRAVHAPTRPATAGPGAVAGGGGAASRPKSPPRSQATPQAVPQPTSQATSKPKSQRRSQPIGGRR